MNHNISNVHQNTMDITSSNPNHNHGTADLARMMQQTDANVAGNVHGGTIMQFMEEAAGVAVRRYFASGSHQRVAALLSRVERLTFRRPIHVGDVAKVHARVVFASRHGVAVCVQVRAERMAWSDDATTSSDDDNTVCNRALLWWVGARLPLDLGSAYVKAIAPPFPVPEERSSWAWSQYQEAAGLYESSRGGEEKPSSSDSAIVPTRTLLRDDSSSSLAPDHNHNSSSAVVVELAQVMLPSDCVHRSGLVSGGVVMKLMDNACGIVAVRHCGTNTVTVAVQGVRLVNPVRLGDVLLVRARPAFSSSKSLEIAVSVRAERYVLGEDGLTLRQEIVAIAEPAFFTFVALPLSGGGGGALPMKPLKPETVEDQEIFEQRRVLYQQRRQALLLGKKRVRSKL